MSHWVCERVHTLFILQDSPHLDIVPQVWCHTLCQEVGYNKGTLCDILLLSPHHQVNNGFTHVTQSIEFWLCSLSTILQFPLFSSNHTLTPKNAKYFYRESSRAPQSSGSFVAEVFLANRRPESAASALGNWSSHPEGARCEGCCGGDLLAEGVTCGSGVTCGVAWRAAAGVKLGPGSRQVQGVFGRNSDHTAPRMHVRDECWRTRTGRVVIGEERIDDQTLRKSTRLTRPSVCACAVGELV